MLISQNSVGVTTFGLSVDITPRIGGLLLGALAWEAMGDVNTYERNFRPVNRARVKAGALKYISGSGGSEYTLALGRHGRHIANTRMKHTNQTRVACR